MSDPSVAELAHEEHSWSSVCLVALLLVAVASAAALRRYKLTTVIPESSAAIAVGFVVGALVSVGSSASQQEALSFNAEWVFFAVLPLIILEAGYTVHRSNLGANIGSISILAVLGTIVNTLVFGFLMFAFANAGWIPLASDSPLECLLFASALSATDPVAILSILGSEPVSTHTDPLLYALVFGEAVVNDATAMVLFAAFAEAASKAESFGAGQLMIVIVQSVYVSLASVMFGVAIALLCCFCMRRMAVMREPATPAPTHQLIVLTLVAYASWSLADLAGLSSVLSLFSTAVTLAHYNTSNLSPKGRMLVSDSFGAMASVAETAVFGWVGVSVGLALGAASELEWHGGLICLTIVTALVARAANIFPLCALANLGRDGRGVVGVPVDPMRKPISPGMQVFLSLGGLRGPVCVMLVSTVREKRGLMLATTLVLVLVTSVVGGSLVGPLLRVTGMYREAHAEDDAAKDPAAAAAAEAASAAPSSRGESPISCEHVVGVNDVASSPVCSSALPSGVLSPSLFDRCAGRARVVRARLMRWEATTMRQWFGGVNQPHGTQQQQPQRRNSCAIEPMDLAAVRAAAAATPAIADAAAPAAAVAPCVCVDVDVPCPPSAPVLSADAAPAPVSTAAVPVVASSVPLAVPL